MNDLIAFLNARLAEREAAAKAATGGRWATAHRRQDHRDGSFAEMWGVDRPDGEPVVEIGMDRDYGSPEGGICRQADADHIVLCDPEGVLLDIEAKRAILADCDLALQELETAQSRARAVLSLTGETPTDVEQRLQRKQVKASTLSWVALWLAQAHSDHPDYREEWRP